ncbi:MAG: hypothetical protein ABW169_07605, partial [Sphingobium sp.]
SMEYWQFLALLVALSFAASRSAFPVSLVLFANWAVNTAGATLSGTQFNWAAMAAADYVSALLILVVRTNRWGLVIVVTYAVQMIAHVAFGLSSQGPWPQYRYWYVLSYTAWAQAFLLLAWAGLDGGRVVRNCLDIKRSVSPDQEVPDGVSSWRARD